MEEESPRSSAMAFYRRLKRANRSQLKSQDEKENLNLMTDYKRKYVNKNQTMNQSVIENDQQNQSSNNLKLNSILSTNRFLKQISDKENYNQTLRQSKDNSLVRIENLDNQSSYSQRPFQECHNKNKSSIKKNQSPLAQNEISAEDLQKLENLIKILKQQQSKESNIAQRISYQRCQEDSNGQSNEIKNSRSISTRRTQPNVYKSYAIDKSNDTNLSTVDLGISHAFYTQNKNNECHSKMATVNDSFSEEFSTIRPSNQFVNSRPDDINLLSSAYPQSPILSNQGNLTTQRLNQTDISDATPNSKQRRQHQNDLSETKVEQRRSKIDNLAKELSQIEEIGLDQQTLYSILEQKTSLLYNEGTDLHLDFQCSNRFQQDTDQFEPNFSNQVINQKCFSEQVKLEEVKSPHQQKESNSFYYHNNETDNCNQSKDFKDTFAMKDLKSNTSFQELQLSQASNQDAYQLQNEGDSTVIIQDLTKSNNDESQYQNQQVQRQSTNKKKPNKSSRKRSSKRQTSKSKASQKLSESKIVNNSEQKQNYQIYNYQDISNKQKEFEYQLNQQVPYQRQDHVSLQDTNIINGAFLQYNQNASEDEQMNNQYNNQSTDQQHKCSSQISQVNLRAKSITPAFAESLSNGQGQQMINLISQSNQAYNIDNPTKPQKQHNSKKRSKTPNYLKNTQANLSRYSKTDLQSSFGNRSQPKLKKSTSNNKRPIKCNCQQKFRESKDLLNQALKNKYEARLQQLKKEFDQKFKKNDQIWKKRVDYNKEQYRKEREKSAYYLQTIKELSTRVEQVEKKNQDLFQLIKLQKQDKNQKNKQHQQEYKNKRTSVSSSSNEEDKEQDNVNIVAKEIKDDQDKLRRIEKILYKKTQ